MFERVCAILQAIPDSRGRGVSFHGTARRAAALALIGLWAGQAFATNYSCTWVTTTGTTSWFTSASWSTCNSTSPNNSSGNTYDAAIAASGTYTITVSSPVTIGLLTLDATGATLSNSSTITATKGVTLDAGTISGGTIAGTGGPNGTTAVSLSASGATGALDNVTLDGSLDVTGQNASAYFDGLTVNDTSGNPPGVINVTGIDSTLISTATQTLDNATVHLGGSTGYGDLNSQSGTLTLGSHLQVLADGTGSYAQIYGNSVVNDGSITYSNGSSNNYIEPTTFANNGTVSLTNGSGVYANGSSFTNNNAITVGSGSTLYLQTYSGATNSTNGTITGANGSAVYLSSYNNSGSPGFANAGAVTMNGSGGTTVLGLGYQGNPGSNTDYAWTNTGTITVTDTDLRLGGYFTPAALGTINRTGGTVELLGYLELGGGTLSTGSGSPLSGLAMYGGTIHDGTIDSNAGASLFASGYNGSFGYSRGTLDNVTLDGSLDITGQNATVYFDGLTVNDTSGNPPGVINITGVDSNLYSTATQTLDNATVHLGGSSGYGDLYSQSGTLTLGSHLQVLADGTGSSGYIYGNSVINDGSITYSNGSSNNYIDPTTFANNGTVALTNGSGVYANGSSFTNNGTLLAESGGTLNIEPTTFTNYSSGTLTGGTYAADAGGTIQLPTNDFTTTLAANITLSGSGSVVEAYDNSTSSYAPLESTLTTIAPTGSLSILGGRNYTTGNALTNDGVLQLGGGTLSSSSFTNSGTLEGYGTVTPQIANSGQITATGGTLTASGGIQGTSGTITVASGAGLTVDAGSTVGTVSNSGTVTAQSGTLSLTKGIQGTSGTLVIDSGGTAAIGGASTVGTLVDNGSAAGALALGGNSITVSNDYQNASFGSGNAFNAHANVSGSGQILAAGTPGMSLTGTAITSGGTVSDTTATLNVGSLRVGGTTSADFDINNVNPSGGPALRGAVESAGLTTPGLSVTGSSFGPISVGGGTVETVSFTPTSSGALTGQSFTVATNFDNVGAKNVSVTGAAYQAAQGQLNNTTSNPNTFNFGTIQVGQSVTSGALSISNTASGASGYVEDLNAQFGAVNANSGTGTAGIVGNGSISGLRAGSTNNSSMTVTVTGTAAGTIVSGIGVDFITAGTVNGVSDGLGTASVGSATYGIDGSIGGTVINQADPVINNPTIDLGNVRIGSASPTGLVSVTNQATSSPQAALDASISGTAPISGSGSFSLLAPGSTDSSSLRVGMSTATAGAVSGTATVALVSDASNVGGCGSSCTLTLPSQNVTVTGNVYQVAQPSLPTAVNVGNYHVGGGLVSQTVTISNTLNAPVGYQEGLDASAGAPTGEATISGGPISNLAAGSSSSALSVGLTGTAAGASSGTVTVNLASDGAGTSGLGILSLPSQTIDVSGTGYNLAAGSTTPSPITIGNQRVGGTNSQALTVGNTAPSGSYTEVLNASFGANGGNAINNGGAISGGLGAGGIAGGSVNDTAMSVGVDTASAGAKSGTVAVNYVSNGTGTSGLGNTSVGSETITVSGNVYQAAQGQLNNTASNPDTFNFGTIQVGQSVTSGALSISNTASGASGYVEDLNAQFGAVNANSGTGTAGIVGNGSISGLRAGSTNNSSMTVTVTGTAAGTIVSGIGVDFITAGTVNGVSDGLGTASVGSATYGIDGSIGGTVISQADPVINNPTIDLGNVRIGSASPTGSVSVTNQATSSPQAALDASISGTAPISGSGSFSLLAPGSTDSSSLRVGMSTATAGAVSGTATVALVSDASNIGGCGSSCKLTLPSQSVTVSGAVYRLASPTLNTSSVTIAARVGDASPAAAVSVTNASPDAYTEGLAASMGSAPNGWTSSGSISNLAAGGTDASSLRVSLDTANAGTVNGSQTVNFTSNGLVDNATPESLGSQSVQLNGSVYTPAVEQVNTTTVDFGVVHVGQSVGPQTVSVTNGAQSTALNDVLTGSLTGSSGPFTASGTLGSGLGAGQGSGSDLSVALDTGTAGVYSDTAEFSGASHDSQLSDLQLATVGIGMSAQVNNYADAAFALDSGSGSLSRSGSDYLLNFGDITQGSGVSSLLSLLNSVTGPADNLEGSFALGALTDVSLSGTNWSGSFSGLGAGQSLGGLGIDVNSALVGNFNDTITLDGMGYYGGATYNPYVDNITLTLEGDVVNSVPSSVPEPGSLALFVMGGMMLAAMATRRRRRLQSNSGRD